MTSGGTKNPFFKALILSSVLLVTVGASQAVAQKYRPRAEEDWITYKNERFGFRLYYPSAIYSGQTAKKTENTDDGIPADALNNEEQAAEIEQLEAESAEETAQTGTSETSNAAPSTLNAGTIVVGPAKKEPAKDNAAIKQEGSPEFTGSIPEQSGSEAYKPETTDNNAQIAENAGTPEEDEAAGSRLTLLSEDGESKIVVFGALNKDGLSPREYRKILLEEFGGYDKLNYQPIGKTWFVLSGYRGDNIYYQKVMFSCRKRVVNVFSINFPIAEKPYYERLVEIMEDHFKTGRGTDTPRNCR